MPIKASTILDPKLSEISVEEDASVDHCVLVINGHCFLRKQASGYCANEADYAVSGERVAIVNLSPTASVSEVSELEV